MIERVNDMLCKNCGKEIPEGSKFCNECGKLVEDVQANYYNTVIKAAEGITPKKKSKKKGWMIFGFTIAGIFIAIVFLVGLFTSICMFEAIDDISVQNSISYNSTADKDGIAPQGSVQFLEGDTVLVSVYVNSKDFWDDKKTFMTNKNMNTAVNYIENCGNWYGKNVNLIYDDGVNDDLKYSMTYENALYDSENDNYEFDKVFNNWIKNNVPVDKLKEKYKTNSIGYVIFLDSSGVSYTIAHFLQDRQKYFNEYSVIYLYQNKKDFEVPSVYAHEILHMFGAIDLYKESKSDGINDDFVNYIRENYPDEIMYTTYEADYSNNYDEITQQMSDITAYMVGMTDDFPELHRYPELAKDCRACFSRY